MPSWKSSQLQNNIPDLHKNQSSVEVPPRLNKNHMKYIYKFFLVILTHIYRLFGPPRVSTLAPCIAGENAFQSDHPGTVPRTQTSLTVKKASKTLTPLASCKSRLPLVIISRILYILCIQFPESTDLDLFLYREDRGSCVQYVLPLWWASQEYHGPSVQL